MNPSLNNTQIGQITAIRHRIPQIRYDFNQNRFVITNQENLDESTQQNQQIIKKSHLLHVYPCTKILSEDKLSKINQKSDFENFDISTNCTWMQVLMPSFKYTTAIITNRPFEGLMFVMIRNWENLEKWIPSSAVWIQRLKHYPILKLIEKVGHSNKECNVDSRLVINELCNAIEQLDNRSFYEIQYSLFQIQMEILMFIRKYILEGKRLGQEIPYRNFTKLYIKLKNLDDSEDVNEERKKVLCLSISKETYPPVPEFSSYQNRLVRIIQSVYVTDVKEFRRKELKLTFDNGVRLLKKQKVQTPESRTLSEAFSPSVIVSKSKALELKRLILSRNYWWLVHDSRLFAFYTSALLLHIQMPKQFGYTCAVESKNIRAGLLHSIARHSDQWVQHIDGFGLVMDKLGLVRQQLDRIKRVDVLDTKGKALAYKEYLDAYEKIKSNDNFQLSLLEAQIQVLRRIQKIVTNQTYLCDQINDSKRMATIFKVKDNQSGDSYLMYLAVSKNLYPPIEQFADPRPVRTIITAFFGSWDFYTKMDVIRTKVWCSDENDNEPKFKLSNNQLTKLISALRNL